MNYIELFERHSIISKIPLKNGAKELPTSVKAQVILMKVQYSELISDFEKNSQAALKELKDSSYPEFDALASKIEHMKDIDNRLLKFKEYKKDSTEPKPVKPSSEEISEADTIRKSEKEFEDMSAKLTKEFMETRTKLLEDEVSTTTPIKTLTKEEFAAIIDVVGDTEVVFPSGVKLQAEYFIEAVATFFVKS